MHRLTPSHPASIDGWVGPPELPGYRAGSVVARLTDLPEVYPDHLYFSLLLLDAQGQLQDDHSGPCYAISRHRPLDDRSRFVRVVAELVRHAPSDDRGLSAIGQALSFIRRMGVEDERLILAARLLDDVSSEQAVVLSLVDLLELSLGVDEAPRVMDDVVAGLAHGAAASRPDGQGAGPKPVDLPARVKQVNAAGLAEQVAFVVGIIGKSQARGYLREVIHFALVPTPDLLAM